MARLLSNVHTMPTRVVPLPMPETDHYHVCTYVRGQMPRISEALTPGDSLMRLQDLVRQTRAAGGRCVGRITQGYVEVRNGDAVGVDGIERVHCWGACTGAGVMAS